jgi:phage baseplate assembly protein W
MAGFGTMAIGSGPFGLGTPVTATAPPDGPAGSRFINTAGDYEQDSTTRQLKQMPPVRQAVMLALRTLQGSSSALPTFGVRLPRKMGDTFESEVRSAIAAALNHLTSANRITLDRVTAVKGIGGRAKITVSYTDIESGKRDSVDV